MEYNQISFMSLPRHITMEYAFQLGKDYKYNR